MKPEPKKEVRTYPDDAEVCTEMSDELLKRLEDETGVLWCGEDNLNPTEFDRINDEYLHFNIMENYTLSQGNRDLEICLTQDEFVAHVKRLVPKKKTVELENATITIHGKEFNGYGSVDLSGNLAGIAQGWKKEAAKIEAQRYVFPLSQWEALITPPLKVECDISFNLNGPESKYSSTFKKYPRLFLSGRE